MGRILAGEEVFPFLWIRIVVPEYHAGGHSCVVKDDLGEQCC